MTTAAAPKLSLSAVKGIPVPLTDQDIRALFGIKDHTIARILRRGPCRKRRADSVDLRLIRRFYVNGQRRWVREDVEALIYNEEEEGGPR